MPSPREKAFAEVRDTAGPAPDTLRGRRKSGADPGGTTSRNKTAQKATKAKKATKAIVKANTRCGALRRDGKTKCKQPAGFRTLHPGYGKCWMHGGRMPNLTKAAEKEMVMQRMAKESTLYGIKRDIGPQEALLEEVQRTAGHVVWLEEKIKTLSEDQLTQYTAKDGKKESEWMAMYREERKMLVSVCNTAIRCGIAERAVKLAEDQGKMIATMLLKLINDLTLDLTPEQRLVAPKICRNLLLELTSGEIITTDQQVIGNDIIDAEMIDAP